MHVGDLVPYLVVPDWQSEVKTSKVSSLTSRGFGQHLVFFSRSLFHIYSSCGGGVWGHRGGRGALSLARDGWKSRPSCPPCLCVTLYCVLSLSTNPRLSFLSCPMPQGSGDEGKMRGMSGTGLGISLISPWGRGIRGMSYVIQSSQSGI